VRIRVSGDSAWLTIKGGLTGFSRPEFEYEIPVQDALEMMKLSIYPPVEKVRHVIYEDGKKWEVDFFEGANKGLVLAELELQDENEAVDLPSWVKKEVTGEIQYHNSRLASHPFSGWM
jgi:adenylate cyclase